MYIPLKNFFYQKVKKLLLKTCFCFHTKSCFLTKMSLLACTLWYRSSGLEAFVVFCIT